MLAAYMSEADVYSNEILIQDHSNQLILNPGKVLFWCNVCFVYI